MGDQTPYLPKIKGYPHKPPLPFWEERMKKKNKGGEEEKGRKKKRREMNPLYLYWLDSPLVQAYQQES